MKRLLRGSLLLLLIAMLGVTCFAATTPKIRVNGAEAKLEDELVIKNGNVFISIRDMARILDLELNWSADKNTANLKNDNVIVGIQENNRWYSKKTKDGKTGTFECESAMAPRSINNKLYVPLSKFTIVVGGSIDWEEKSNTYNILCGWTVDYLNNTTASVYAGTGKKGGTDGELKKSQFKYAQSMYTTSDKVTYVSDSGVLRKMTANGVETLKMTPSDIKVSSLRGIDNTVYALSGKYEVKQKKQKESRYGIFKIENDTFKELYIQNADEAKILDFDMLSVDLITLLKQDTKSGKKYIEFVYLKAKNTPAIAGTKVDVDKSITCLASDDKRVYLGSSKGSIYCFDTEEGSLNLWAGQDDKHNFKDGEEPLFCVPRKMKYYRNNLYVLDYNMLRSVAISEKGQVRSCSTVVGKISALINSKMSSGKNKDLLLSGTNPIDFCMSPEGILITDCAQYKIMIIK